jgi:hypothetical protein
MRIRRSATQFLGGLRKVCRVEVPPRGSGDVPELCPPPRHFQGNRGVISHLTLALRYAPTITLSLRQTTIFWFLGRFSHTEKLEKVRGAVAVVRANKQSGDNMMAELP